MCSAEGIQAPPMALYTYKERVPKKVVENFPQYPNDWGIGISENGWMTSEIFYKYITNVFHPWLLKQQIQFPVIIYMDGHSSHLSIPLVKFCRERNIE